VVSELTVFKRIIAFFCSIAISFSLLSAPVAAITGEEAALGLGVLQFAYQLYHDWKTDHPNAPDSEYSGFNPGGVFGGGASREEINTAYDSYVQTLPATGYNSEGKFIIYAQHDYFYNDSSGNNATYLFCPHHEYDSDKPQGVLSSDCNNLIYTVKPLFDRTTCIFYRMYHYQKLVAPVTGTYETILSPLAKVSVGYPDGSNISTVVMRKEVASKSFVAGTEYSLRDVLLSTDWGGEWSVPVSYGAAQFFPLSFLVTPAELFDSDIYSTTTRPTSITGGNYGIVGDNNEITKVEDNSTIINETNNTYYNPATGTTVPITNWSYDYSDRSYKVTLENGDTATVTYGDENISITENTTVSGDTVTNNYTIYYLVDASDPSGCTHNWTETSTTPATCTVPGSRLLTCSLCSQTKTETIPALGHDWQVKQTVTTQYDDTGQLTQQGYTIFECSTCHEQYKSEDGALPPGGGSGTDPGGDEGETIWDKLGHLIGAIGNGVISVIEGVLGKLLDALIALAEMLVEKLKTVVDAVLKIFDEIPKLFGGFLDFLAALFPFLPPELMTILTFGVIAVVFIGIIKAVRR